MQRLWMICVSALMLLVAACAPAATPQVALSPTPESAGSGGVGAVGTSVPAAGAQAANAPAWLELPLVDARTGATFTLADFSGKTVLARAVGQW
ncbi:MAG: hypothetical protein SF123_23175 [Chloroflexota bacterium]|nr:hypothetical protein [Chloroflexota bacterium]